MASMQVSDTKRVVEGCDGQEQMMELKRLQVAHEGIRLLLNSDLKQAEELFKVSRLVIFYLYNSYMYVSLCGCSVIAEYMAKLQFVLIHVDTY